MEWALSPNITVESSFTHERCSITLPPWVRTLDEVKIYAREAHNNLSAADGNSRRFHPAVVALMDGNNHEMIVDMPSLTKCRHIILVTHFSELKGDLSAEVELQYDTRSNSIPAPSATFAPATECEVTTPVAEACLPGQSGNSATDLKPESLQLKSIELEELKSMVEDCQEPVKVLRTSSVLPDVNEEERCDESCQDVRVLDCSTVDQGNRSADVLTNDFIITDPPLTSEQQQSRFAAEQHQMPSNSKHSPFQPEGHQLLPEVRAQSAGQPPANAVSSQTVLQLTETVDCSPNNVATTVMVPKLADGFDALIERHQSIIRRVKTHLTRHVSHDEHVAGKVLNRLISPEPNDCFDIASREVSTLESHQRKHLPLISPPRESNNQYEKGETPVTNISIVATADEFEGDTLPCDPEELPSCHLDCFPSCQTSPAFSPCDSFAEIGVQMDEVDLPRSLADTLPPVAPVCRTTTTASPPQEPSGIHLEGTAVSQAHCSEQIPFESLSVTSAATVRQNTAAYLQECLRMRLSTREHLLFREVIAEAADHASLPALPQIVIEGPPGSGVSTTGAIIALDWMLSRDMAQGVTTLLLPVRRHDAVELFFERDDVDTQEELLTFWISEVLDAVGAAVGTNLRTVFAFLFGGDSADDLSHAVDALQQGRLTLFDHERPVALANIVEGIREIRAVLRSEDWHSKLFAAVRLLPMMLSRYFGFGRETYFFDNASITETTLPTGHPWMSFACSVAELLSEGAYSSVISCIHSVADPLAGLGRATTLSTIDLVSSDVCRRRYGFPLYLQTLDRRANERKIFPVNIFLGAPGYLQLLYRFVQENRRAEADNNCVVVEDSESADALLELSLLSSEVRSR